MIEVAALTQWSAFLVFALIAVAGALGMATTMSMYRSGIFLMASFIGVAGLFILLLADLLALLQVMMYIGGMLVMILFMVLFAHDPGGSMMAGMELPLIERFFSLGIKPSGGHSDHQHGSENAPQHQDHQEGGQDHRGMAMSEMSMSTPIKRPAALLAAVVGLFLLGLLLLRPAWPVKAEKPDPRSAQKVGSLLMSKYMIAFEGAGLLILTGIFGAVLVARTAHRAEGLREDRVAQEGTPPLEHDALPPLSRPPREAEPVEITDIQKDEGS